ncbi:(R)-2-hydroxyisocaproyl-CoA dehydratase subunit beta [Clostridium sediminicola]|uniref:2-hydroxyacyl-CoA dehydratase subunit D n=1 Tax=Clostridium sediminicola TaxID=3114879 RepID=UPI0031F203A5
MNYEKLFDTSISNESVKAWKAQEKKVIGTICCHVPEEIIHAAGMLPVRVRATGCTDSSEAETWMSSLSCSYARSCLQYLMDGTYDIDGLITSDGCTMASRIYDNWKHIDPNKEKHFLRDLGAPRMVKDLSIDFYKDELNDIREGIEKFAGVKITDEKLKASVELYNETRRLIRELYELRMAENPVISGSDTLKITLAATSMPKEEFNELLKAFLADAKNRTPITDHRIRLMVIGSALDDPEYTKVIEDKGGLIVTDALCFGSRYLWEPVELHDDDVMGAIAKSYLTRPVCPRMIDLHDELHEFIMKMIKDYKVDGIIYEKLHNCECWGGEAVYLDDLMKNANIPMLAVEREELMANAGQLAIRAEAFIEMIDKEDE